MKIAKPINKVQENWNELCQHGGGRNGGPPRGKVQELLFWGSQRLNDLAHDEIQGQLKLFSDRDPWKVCFAFGLGWGHLAKIDADFTDAATIALDCLDQEAIKDACKFRLERGPTPIKQSLEGGYLMFQRTRLPNGLPDTLARYRTAQERWLSQLLSPAVERPRYIGSWNSTAMFMAALFSDRKLWSELKDCEVMLPPGGPIYNGLKLLHMAHITSQPPVGSELDDQAFEPGSIYENNGYMKELIAGKLDWSLIDIHTGIYMLGTRAPESANWL